MTTAPASRPAALRVPTAAPNGTAATAAALGLAGVLAQVLRVEDVPLDADVFEDLGADSMLMAQFCARVRKREDLPSPSMKDVYSHRTVRSLAAALGAPPATRAEQGLSEVLAQVLRVERVPLDADVFEDLGADSMLLAQFCARVRKREDLPSPSMKDVYSHRTVRGLATALAGAAPVPTASRPPVARPPLAASRLEHALCGTLQLLAFLAYSYVAAVVAVAGYDWVDAASGVVDTYERSVVFGGATFLGASAVPVVAKWVLIGRFTAQEIRIWSLAYVRFWIVKTLIRSSPMALLTVGSPLYGVYLRALGARVGRGVAVFARTLPVCTDLITIGDDTVISKDCSIAGYRAHGGVIQTGPVTLGKDVFLSEATVLDIRTTMEDGAQLGHSSSLHPDQLVPAGERWYGSPGRPTSTDFRVVGPAACGSVRRALYPVLQLLATVLVYLPLTMGFLGVLTSAFPGLSTLLDPGPLALASWAFYGDVLLGSLLLFLAYVVASLLLALTVPRVLARAIRADEVYPLYGVHHSIHRTIMRLTNSKLLMTLFGDSSYVVPYLQALGYDLTGVRNTGSNFGTVVRHETPYHVTVGSGTMIADGLSINNVDYSSSSFRVSRVTIGARNFLGNGIAYPSQGRTGDNCLLGTRVFIPIEGEVREGVGLLGSPCFEIPRSVERDTTLTELGSEDELRTRLAAKNRYNLRSMGLFLVVRWVIVLLLTLVAVLSVELSASFGAAAIAGASVLSLLVPLGWSLLVERAVARFRPMQPQSCSIYDPYFWWHERYWKVVSTSNLLNGTPFKALQWRLAGVRIGRRLFDDGVNITERTLVTIGDDCTLNMRTEIQCHSQEDGAFKSDRTTIGAGCTLGVGALVHYGVSVGDGAVLACDSFVMKGTEVPPGTSWAGNPASEQADSTGVERALPAQRER